MVVLAQLVEHRIVVPSVVGSSPTFHPHRCNTISYGGFSFVNCQNRVKTGKTVHFYSTFHFCKLLIYSIIKIGSLKRVRGTIF